jgi:hypothetical protein
MYVLSSETNLLIHGFIAVVIIGVFYNLMVSTKVYGGVIGKAIRLIGIATLFVAASAFEKVLVNFNVIHPSFVLSVVQDLITVLSLVFLGLGFSKLASAGK